jgi:hypothetical protein
MKTKLSCRQMAAFCVGTEQTRRRIVCEAKIPYGGSKARYSYYVQVKGAIREYHRESHPKTWLFGRASRFLTDSALARTSQRKAKLVNNAQALLRYGRAFASRAFHILPQVRMTHPIGGLSLTVSPDMHVTEEDSERFLRVEATNCTIEEEEVMATLIWLAASARLPDLPASACAVLDLRSGREVRSPTPTSQMLRRLESVCLEFAAMYDLVS